MKSREGLQAPNSEEAFDGMNTMNEDRKSTRSILFMLSGPAFAEPRGSVKCRHHTDIIIP